VRLGKAPTITLGEAAARYYETTLKIQRFAAENLCLPRLSAFSLPAHNGVVAGSSPAGPTILFNELRNRIR
jgi:hypothetical protein